MSKSIDEEIERFLIWAESNGFKFDWDDEIGYHWYDAEDRRMLFTEKLFQMYKQDDWISVEEKQKPPYGEEVEVSFDGGKTVECTAKFSENPICMMAGIAGGYGYFKNQFATIKDNLNLPDVTHWRPLPNRQSIDDLAKKKYPVHPIYGDALSSLTWNGYINHLRQAFSAGYKQRSDELKDDAWKQKLAEAFHQQSFEDFRSDEQSIALWMAENLL